MKCVKIKELREKRSWSQDHLAEATGLSLRTIQRAEGGQNISKETVLNIAAALDVPLNELAGPGSNRKFLLLKTFIAGILAVSLMISWLLYGRELISQNQYILDYRIYLMTVSFLTGIAWGIGSAWYLHHHQAFIRDIFQFLSGAFLIFLCFNFMPFIKYPHDQYSAAFPWIATGLVPMGISWSILLWILGDLKKILIIR